MDVASELLNGTPRRCGAGLRVDELFGDRPDILDAIRVARSERKVSFQFIADILSKEGETVSGTAVQNWLRGQGVQ